MDKLDIYKAAFLNLISGVYYKKTVTIKLELTQNEAATVFNFCKEYKKYNHNKTLTAVCNKYLKELERQNIIVK